MINAWQSVSLGDVCNIYDGPHATPTKISEGPIFLGVHNLNEGRLDLSETAHISEDDYVLWTRRIVPRAEDIVFSYETALGQAAILPTNLRCCLGRRLGLLRPRKEVIDPYYLIYTYLGPDFQDVLRTYTIQGSTVDRIPLTRMSDFPILLPPLEEQRKIAAILSTWDEAIGLVEQLIGALGRRKQALMQLLLTGAVRFPGFEGEWERKHLREIFERVTRKNKERNTNVLTISAQQGLISQERFFNKVVAGEAIENYYLLKEGEFAYNKSYSNGYPFGAIKRLDAEDGILSVLYICFRLIDDLNNSDYFAHFFENGGLNRGIFEVAQEGARNHGLLNIGVDEFFDIMLHLPSPDEQNKVADFLNVAEEVLQLVRQEHNALQAQKRGLMQQLLTGQVRV